MPTLQITSLRGGLNNSDPPISLADDQCTVATNVEFLRSTCGERRRGHDAIDLTGSDLATMGSIIWVHRHLPASDPADAQLWALGLSVDQLSVVLAYKDTTWHTVTVPDAFVLDNLSEYQVQGVSLHGKLFIFYKSAVDRLHVFDPRISMTALRQVGLDPVVTAPTAVEVGSGSYSGTRYIRTREVVQVSGVTVLRSEPSEVLTFVPTGSALYIDVTKPATVNSIATHWELEQSSDAANFYVTDTIAIGTTIRSTGWTTAQLADFPLSEDIGAYTPPHSAKHGIADEDRLVIFGAWEDSTRESSGSWTPVYNATGVGNDERIPLDPVSTVNLDGFNGGAITDVSSATAGEIWVFKQDHTYKMTRTGQLTRAYTAVTMSHVRGALEGSVCDGVDPAGNPAVFLADIAAGPCLITRSGIKQCGQDVWGTWRDLYLSPSSNKSITALYYPHANQFHLWFYHIDDIDDEGTITASQQRLVLQVNEMRETESGWRRGWSLWTGSSLVYDACLFSDNIDAGVDRNQAMRPFIAITPANILLGDTGDDDNGSTYSAQITTKPYALAQVQTEFEVKTAKLIAKAETDATLVVSAIPNFGTSTTKLAEPLDFSPNGDELHVTKFMDDLGISGCEVVQFDFSDTDIPGTRWELARFTATLTAGQGS